MDVERFVSFVLLASAVACWAGQADAEVVDSTAAGFLVRSEVLVSATPDSVYRALVERIGSWWDPQHTWSGDAGNLALDARPGGCFCERLPGGGGVWHLTVVYASPGKLLRLCGGLGPLQAAGVAGSLTFALEGVTGGTRLQSSYSVGGYFTGGLAGMAVPVDRVLTEQVLRLRSLVETGRPGSE